MVENAYLMQISYEKIRYQTLWCQGRSECDVQYVTHVRQMTGQTSKWSPTTFPSSGTKVCVPWKKSVSGGDSLLHVGVCCKSLASQVLLNPYPANVENRVSS
jgi:hypothetical protein